MARRRIFTGILRLWSTLTDRRPCGGLELEPRAPVGDILAPKSARPIGSSVAVK